MNTEIRYDPSTEIGAIVVSFPFQRSVSKEVYDALYKFAKAFGASEEEARTYAGYLDYPKPSIAIAEAVEAFPQIIAKEWPRPRCPFGNG